MSKKEKRLGKGLRRDYRESLLSREVQTPESLKFQKSKSLATQKSNDLKVKKSRRQATIYFTKEQLRAIKEIQLKLMDSFKIENSEVAGLGIEILREIFKIPEVQKSNNLEVLKSKCLDILKGSKNT